MIAAKYAPQIFFQDTIEAARGIILTPEAGLSTDERWERETAWTAERVLFEPGLIIDYGCGVGRMSKVMVDRGHPVIGVDASESMRAMAAQEIPDAGVFTALSTRMLRQLVENGMRASGIIAVWVLQHIPQEELEAGVIPLIESALADHGTLWTMERPERFVPATMGDMGFGWFSDGFDVHSLLASRFFLRTSEDVPDTLCAPGAKLCSWGKRQWP